MPRQENHTEWGGRFYGSIPQNYLRAKLKRGKVSVLIDTQHMAKIHKTHRRHMAFSALAGGPELGITLVCPLSFWP